MNLCDLFYYFGNSLRVFFSVYSVSVRCSSSGLFESVGGLFVYPSGGLNIVQITTKIRSVAFLLY